MNQIDELPEPTSYGHDFNYAQWTGNTEVTLCNVPWSNSYRDIVRFEGGRSELNNYLDNQTGPTIRVPNATYHRPGHPIKLRIPYGKALGFNYIRAYNPPQPGQDGDIGRSYYYFINGINHVNPSTTEFMLQLDVVQSYIYDVRFGMCYIQRGHIGVANTNQFHDYGKEFLAIPEGMDIGADYQVADVHSRKIASARSNDVGYSVMVITTVAFDTDPGTVAKPQFKTASGNKLENLPNGAEVYVFEDAADFEKFLVVYRDKPWITQGIISITPIPPNLAVEYGMRAHTKQVSGLTIKEVSDTKLDVLKKTMGKDWRDHVVNNILPERYRNLKKFLTSPYTVLELTANTGTPLVLKPENWNSSEMTVVEVPHFAQPGPRLMFYPFRYNAAPGSPVETDAQGVVNDGGEFLDMATGIFNFPSFSLVNNSYLSFMASNANSISYQHSSADWSQQRALAGNDVAYNQATAGIGTSQELMGIGIDASRQSTTLANETAMLQGLQGGANGVLSNAGRGNMLGAAGAIANAAAGTAISMNQNEQSFGISSNAARRSNAATTDNMAYNRDTNKGYADMAAQGDYANAIAGINAKVQDAQMIQPTTSGQVGGDAFIFSQYRWGYDIKVKVIQSGSIARLGEYWLRYGYAVQRWAQIPESLQVMENFTYWKLTETYLNGNIPESFKETIRGIFEKGVTVWAKPGYIGNIDIANNEPNAGVWL